MVGASGTSGRQKRWAKHRDTMLLLTLNNNIVAKNENVATPKRNTLANTAERHTNEVQRWVARMECQPDSAKACTQKAHAKKRAEHQQAEGH